MPDTTTEAILEAARKRWPEAELIDVECRLSVLVPKVVAGGTIHTSITKFAPDLPALLAKLKGEEDGA